MLSRLPSPRIKPTSIFLRSARRPNPGRGSTYRRGIAVQTTGTSSIRNLREMTNVDDAGVGCATEACEGLWNKSGHNWGHR
jgi:hypothetical protein